MSNDLVLFQMLENVEFMIIAIIMVTVMISRARSFPRKFLAEPQNLCSCCGIEPRNGIHVFGAEFDVSSLKQFFSSKMTKVALLRRHQTNLFIFIFAFSNNQ